MKISLTSKCKNEGIKVLVYGKSGVGKTVLCSTAPRPLIISAESGLLSLRNYDIPYTVVKSLDDLNAAYKWVTTAKDASYFETICLDSISEIADIVLSNAKQNVRDKRQAYGELIDEMMKVIKKFRDLRGKNVYFSARESKIVDTASGTVVYQPDMPGSKLGPQLPYYFDEVFRMDIETKDNKQRRYLRTRADYQCEAKDRSGVLKAKEQPNLTKIFNTIKKG